MVLVQKQTYGIMEQGRGPRNKPILLWSVRVSQRRQGRNKWGKQSIQQAVLESGTAALNSTLEHKMA